MTLETLATKGFQKGTVEMIVARYRALTPNSCSSSSGTSSAVEMIVARYRALTQINSSHILSPISL